MHVQAWRGFHRSLSPDNRLSVIQPEALPRRVLPTSFSTCFLFNRLSSFTSTATSVLFQESFFSVVFLLLMFHLHHLALWCLRSPPSCVYVCLCVAAAIFHPVGSLVRRGSRKCDDPLMFCEAHHNFTHKTAFYGTCLPPYPVHTHTRTHMLCWCCSPTSWTALRGCRFVSSVQRIKQSTPPLLLPLIPHLHSCHSLFSLSSPHHPYFFNLHLYFTVSPPSFCSVFHPAADGSDWSWRRNHRNVQPISFWANRVTVIHEAAQLPLSACLPGEAHARLSSSQHSSGVQQHASHASVV